MSPVGKTRDAGFQIGVSRTLDHPVEDVWELVASDQGLDIWLGEGARPTPERGTPWRARDGATGETRGYRELDRIRVTARAADADADAETTIQVAVRAAPGGRAMLRLHEERLAGPEERERRRAHWQDVLGRLEQALGDG